MLKEILFNHMMSQEAEEEKDDNNQPGAPGCQLRASLPGSPEGLSAASDENQASLDLQKVDSQLRCGHTGLSETAECNGEGNF